MTAEACVQSGYVLRKGKCYTPVLESPRKSVPTLVGSGECVRPTASIESGLLAAEGATHMLVGRHDPTACALRLHASVGVRNRSRPDTFHGIAGR